HVAAQYGISLLFEDKPPAKALGRDVRPGRVTRRVESGVTVAAARAEFREPTTGERWSRAVFAALLPGQRVQAYVCGADVAEDVFDRLLADAARGVPTGPLPSGRHFLLRDLRPDEREQVLVAALKRRLARREAGALDSLEDLLPLLEQFRGLEVP